MSRIIPRFSSRGTAYKIIPPKNTEGGSSLKWETVGSTLDFVLLHFGIWSPSDTFMWNCCPQLDKAIAQRYDNHKSSLITLTRWKFSTHRFPVTLTRNVSVLHKLHKCNSALQFSSCMLLLYVPYIGSPLDEGNVSHICTLT